MSANETDPPAGPALRRAEAAREAVGEAIEGHFDRLAAMGGPGPSEFEADLRAAGRLMARNTRRQLAANLTLVRRLMEATSLPAMLEIQQDFLRRQADWAMRDWERAQSQALALLDEEGRRAGGQRPAPVPGRISHDPEAGPPEPGSPDTDPS